MLLILIYNNHVLSFAFRVALLSTALHLLGICNDYCIIPTESLLETWVFYLKKLSMVLIFFTHAVVLSLREPVE